MPTALLLMGTVGAGKTTTADAAGLHVQAASSACAPAVLASRLRDRHLEEPAELAWHLDRAPELDAILDAARVADADVATDSRTPMDVAGEVLRLIGWDI